MWVGEMYGDDAKRTHNKWKNKIESLTYQFTQDINELRSLIENFNNRELGLQLGFNRIFTVEEGQHPILLEEILGKRINIESAIIMDKILQFTDFGLHFKIPSVYIIQRDCPADLYLTGQLNGQIPFS